MWTVIYMAKSAEVSKTLKELLTREGLVVKVRAFEKAKHGTLGSYEVMVPESEVDDAHRIIIEHGF